MTEGDTYKIPYSISGPNMKIAISERKISLLEKRMNGPNKDGNNPISPKKKEEDLENIKNKLLKTEHPMIIKNNSKETAASMNSGTLSGQSRKSKDLSLYDFFKVKGKNATKSAERPSEVNTTPQFLNKKRKIPLKKINLGLPGQFSNLKSYIKANPNKKTKFALGETGIKIDKNNLQGNDSAELRKVLKSQEEKIKEKDEEISLLNDKVEAIKENLTAVKNNYKIAQDENELYKIDIINFVKQIEEINRKEITKRINDQQYSIGKLVCQRNSTGQIIEFFDEGEEFKSLNKKLSNITSQRNKILLEKNDMDQFLIKYKLDELEKEEQDLKSYKEILVRQKAKLIHDINLLREESKCIYNNKWPLFSQRYQILSLLGKGGYSEVYKAYDLNSHCYVACKINHLESNWSAEVRDNYIRHTMRENDILKKLSHKNIIKYYDTIEINNNSFGTVLELCSGNDLFSHLKLRKKLKEEEVKTIVKQILSALKYLSSLPKKIIHYDLKPQNILFKDMEVKLTDFGLAKIMDNSDQLELTSQGVGTYYYLPPECFEKKENAIISPKLDIWSLGVMTYEMIYGYKPYFGRAAPEKVLIDKSFLLQPPVFDENTPISNECKDFIKGCLEYNQRRRWDVIQAINSKFISHP
ncbi:MAG: protein kinase [archaeon]|nr:protein kinase [archaeon]